MNRWVVLTFHEDDKTYTTSTHEDINAALEDYFFHQKLKQLYKRNNRYALVLEGSEFPIDGYIPGEMAIGKKYKTSK